MPIYNIKLSWNMALEGYVGKDKINMNTREETWIEKKKSIYDSYLSDR